MANINKVYLLFPPNLSNDYAAFKSEEASNKANKIFNYYNSNAVTEKNINLKKSINKSKKLLTNFSSEKKLKISTDLNDEYDYIIKSKGIRIRPIIESKKKININNLLKDKRKIKSSNQEENKNNINPVFNIKKWSGTSRNKLILKSENTMSSQEKKKTFFTNDTLASFNKDLFNIRINLKNAKNFSLYRNRLKKSKNTQTKTSITEYNHKLHKNNSNKINKKNKKYFYPFKTKYIFKSREILSTVKFKDLPENVTKINKFYLDSLKLESTKCFGNNFSILRKEQFSAKFRNPLLNNNLLNEKKLVTEEKSKKINEDIISGQGILKEINLDKIKKSGRKKAMNIKYIYFRFKIWIIRFAEFCKMLEIKPFIYINLHYRFFHNKDILFHETQLIKTSELIKSIKSKNLNSVIKLIEEYPATVLGKDYFQYSPLHWAVKMKFLEAIPNLILYGADPNSKNFLGETPLHTAIKNNDYESTVLLLTFTADPFVKNNEGKKPFDDASDYEMNIIHNKIENLYYINTFKKSKLFVYNVQKKFIDFIMEEFRTQISKDPLNIIENLYKKKKKGKNEDSK